MKARGRPTLKILWALLLIVGVFGVSLILIGANRDKVFPVQDEYAGAAGDETIIFIHSDRSKEHGEDGLPEELNPGDQQSQMDLDIPRIEPTNIPGVDVDFEDELRTSRSEDFQNLGKGPDEAKSDVRNEPIQNENYGDFRPPAFPLPPEDSNAANEIQDPTPAEAPPKLERPDILGQLKPTTHKAPDWNENLKVLERQMCGYPVEPSKFCICCYFETCPQLKLFPDDRNSSHIQYTGQCLQICTQYIIPEERSNPVGINLKANFGLKSMAKKVAKFVSIPGVAQEILNCYSCLASLCTEIAAVKETLRKANLGALVMSRRLVNVDKLLSFQGICKEQCASFFPLSISGVTYNKVYRL